jgi:hypothetical protein
MNTLYWNSSGDKDSEMANDIKILEYKDTVFYISFTKSFLYILTSVLMLLERKQIKTEIENSPLLDINDMLTEEIYQNIIEQSKSPEDNKLIEDYRKLMENQKTNKLSKSDSVGSTTHNAINSDK